MRSNHIPSSRRAMRAVLAVLALAAVMTALAPVTPAMAAPRRADLAVTATASPTEVSTAGGRATIDINVQNIGRASADNVTATLRARCPVAS